MFRSWKWLLLAALAVISIAILAAASVTATRGDGAVVWYLGHCGFAVRTQNHLLIIDYQERRDGTEPKARPGRPSLANGWIDPQEIKDLKVRVLVSHSHNDHYDSVILGWEKAIPDIVYYFGWKAAEDPAYNHLVGPRAELTSGGLEIATINSHHSGVPEVAWLVEVDGLVIYHNGDCQPDDPASSYDFLRKKANHIDLAFVPPVLLSPNFLPFWKEFFTAETQSTQRLKTQKPLISRMGSSGHGLLLSRRDGAARRQSYFLCDLCVSAVCFLLGCGR